MDPTSDPTAPGICRDAKFQGSMGCDDVNDGGAECDALYGGESLVSSNCRYLLTMEQSGNLVLYEVSGSRRRLLQSLTSGWSTDTAVAAGEPEFTFFRNGIESGLVILESDGDALWTVTTASSGDGLVLSLGDDATLDLADGEATALWTVSGSFGRDIAVDSDSDSDADSAANAGDAANTGTAGTVDDHHTKQWWFWMMLFLSITIIAVVAVFRFSKKEQSAGIDDLEMSNVDALKLSDATSISKMVSPSPTVDDDANGNGLASMSPYSGHIAAVSSVSAVASIAGAATRGGPAEGIDVEEAVVPRHEAVESNVSITLEDAAAARSVEVDSHSVFKQSLRHILEDKEPDHEPLRLTTGHYAQPSMEPEPMMTRPTKQSGGAATSISVMVDAPLNADGTETASNIEMEHDDDDLDDEMGANYDALYTRGSGHTPGPDEMEEMVEAAATGSGFVE